MLRVDIYVDASGGVKEVQCAGHSAMRLQKRGRKDDVETNERKGWRESRSIHGEIGIKDRHPRTRCRAATYASHPDEST
jgi:hypothetical protein